jgi:Ni2+-binding GTPase involved in maturation of urease and hydrogenase
MEAYWKALCAAELDGRVLDLGNANLVDKTGRNDGGSKLFVRACYEPLAKLLMEARRSYKNVVITGTPGIGKTAFRNFFVFYLAQSTKTAGITFIIVLHGTPDERSDSCSVLTVSGGIPLALRVASRDLFNHVSRENASIVYLVDVSEGDSKAMKLFPSGRTDHDIHFAK